MPSPSVPRIHQLDVKNPQGTHSITYYEWGNPNATETLFCLHGLTRNGRDFDFLAHYFEDEYRIIAPDLVGRGKSGWLQSPVDYQIPQYISDLRSLITYLGIHQMTWIGTSLGGILGIILASQPHSPIQRLVLNDIGPVIKKEALMALSASIQKEPVFATLDELKTYLKLAYRNTGDADEHQWDHMTQHDHRQTAEGQFARAYDPDLFKGQSLSELRDIELWDVFDQVKCPILVLHGTESPLLTPAVCEAMKAHHPALTVIDLPGVDHAPSLMVKEYIRLIEQWLNAHTPELRHQPICPS